MAGGQSVDTVALLTEFEAQVVDDAWQALGRSHAGHYEAAGERVTKQRLTDMYGLIVTAIRDRDLSPVTAYAARVARELFDAGYGISEVQTAYNALEEAAWRHLVEREPPAELVGRSRC
jgi:hypothetical protein